MVWISLAGFPSRSGLTQRIDGARRGAARGRGGRGALGAAAREQRTTRVLGRASLLIVTADGAWGACAIKLAVPGERVGVPIEHAQLEAHSDGT